MQGPFTKDRSRKVLVSYWRQGDFATSGVPVRAAQLATATRTRTGYSNRNHRQQIRAHSNAGTIMDGVLTSIDFQRGGAEMAYRWPLNVNSDQVKREKVWGDLSMTTVNFVTFNPIDSPNPEAAIRASAAAYQQIRKAQVLFQDLRFSVKLVRPFGCLRDPLPVFRTLLGIGLIRVKDVRRPTQSHG